MGIRRKVFYPVAFAATLFASSAMAKVNPTVINAGEPEFSVTDYFLEGQEVFSPTPGLTALEIGLIENIRFSGPFEAAFDKNGERDFLADKSTDPLWNAVNILFPSNNGQLGTTTSATTNFAQYVVIPKTPALLLNYAKKVEDVKGKAYLPAKVTQEFAAEIMKTLVGMGTSKSTIENFKKVKLNPLLNAIRESIEAEKKGTSLYPRGTTVQVIEAFFCYQFNVQTEMWKLIEDLDGSIVDKSKPLPTGEKYLEEKDLATIAVKKDFNLDDIFDLANASIFTSLTPYKSGVNLLNNGTTQFYNRANNAYIKGKTFMDCAETALRHIDQLLRFDPISREFNSKPIEAFVAQKEKLSGIKNPYFDNYKAFSKKQTVLLANAGDIGTRSLWNTVVGNLPNTAYRQDGSNEIKSGFMNLLQTVDTVFSLSLKPPPTAGLNAKKTWVEESLKTYFSALNPAYTYSIDLQASEELDELTGDAVVTVTDTANAEGLFSFNLHSAVSSIQGHTEVNSLTVLKQQKFKDYTDDIKNHLNVIQKGTTDESLLLLASPDLQNDVHPLYKLFPQPLFDSTTKINFLKELVENYDDWVKNYPSFKTQLPMLQLMTKNVLNNIPWEDTQTQENIGPVLFSMVKSTDFRDLIYEGAKYFKPRLSSFEDTKDIIKNFKTLDFLDLSGNNKITGPIQITEEFKALKKLSLSKTRLTGLTELKNALNLEYLNLGYTTQFSEVEIEGAEKLKELNIVRSGVSKLTIKNSPNLENLNLSFTEKLSELLFPGSLDKLKSIQLTRSGISKLPGLDNLHNLETLSLRLTKNLLDLDFIKPLEKLTTLSLAGSGISTLTGLDNLESLKELDLEDAANLTHLKFEKDNKDLVLKLQGSGIRSRADIEGFDHLDPNNVHF